MVQYPRSDFSLKKTNSQRPLGPSYDDGSTKGSPTSSIGVPPPPWNVCLPIQQGWDKLPSNTGWTGLVGGWLDPPGVATISLGIN